MSIVVLSPHLDDAVLSLGATIRWWARSGQDVSVVTVLGNDPDSHAPPHPWDLSCGFRTAGEAARERRAEDAYACDIIRARPQWLSYGDEEHGRGACDQDIAAAVAPLLNDATLVFIPGYPLVNPDHAWLGNLILQHDLVRASRLGLYAEQPYSTSVLMGRSRRRGHTRSLPAAVTTLLRHALWSGSTGRDNDQWTWSASRPPARDWVGKQRAIRAYGSQIAGLGPLPRARIALYEMGSGGEQIAFAPKM